MAEEAKQDAAEAAQRKRLAGERHKKQLEDETRLAKTRAEQNAKAVEERARFVQHALRSITTR